MARTDRSLMIDSREKSFGQRLQFGQPGGKFEPLGPRTIFLGRRDRHWYTHYSEEPIFCLFTSLIFQINHEFTLWDNDFTYLMGWTRINSGFTLIFAYSLFTSDFPFWLLPFLLLPFYLPFGWGRKGAPSIIRATCAFDTKKYKNVDAVLAVSPCVV